MKHNMHNNMSPSESTLSKTFMNLNFFKPILSNTWPKKTSASVARVYYMAFINVL